MSGVSGNGQGNGDPTTASLALSNRGPRFPGVPTITDGAGAVV